MEDVLEADTEAVDEAVEDIFEATTENQSGRSFQDAAANLKLFSTFGGAKEDDRIFIVFIDIFAQAEPAEEKDEELDDIDELI